MNTAQHTGFDKALELYNRRTASLDALPSNVSQDMETEACDLRTAAERQLFRQKVHSVADVRALAEVIFLDPDALPMPEHTTALLNALRSLDKRNPSRTFNPSAWLRALERHGGGWVMQDDEVSFLYPGNKPEVIDSLMWELETRDGCEAVKEEIRKREASSVEAKPTWQTLLSAYQTADARLKEHSAEVDTSKCGSPENVAHEAKTDRLADEHTEALEALLRYPSPDKAAFAFKARVLAEHQAYQWATGKELTGIIADEAEQLAA